MSFNSKLIQKGTQDGSRAFLLYGTPKVGKSVFASSAPNTFIIRTEDRHKHIECPKSPVVQCIQRRLLDNGECDPNDKRIALYDIFEFLMNEKHGFKTIVIDTIDWLEPLLHKHICEKNGWKSLVEDREKEVNFGKGLKFHAVAGWRKLLENFDYLRNELGINIVLISHSAILKVDPPDSESYDMYVMKVDKNALSVLEEWADMIGFYHRKNFVSDDGKPIGDNKRILHLGGDNPAFISGNSFNLPDEIEVNLNEASKIMTYILTGKGEK